MIVCVFSYGQILAQSISMSIGTVTAKPGEVISVPINVSNFNNIGAISLYIEFDTNVLTYSGVSDQPLQGNFTNNAAGNIIILGWFSSTALNLDNGKLVNINFTYKGGISTLNFNQTFCEIAGPDGTILPVQFYNGGVNTINVNVEYDHKPVQEFALSLNYPNPFNPSTKINYSIPSYSRVRLAVYTLTGELISELINQEQDAGNYIISYDAGELSSGIYLIRLSAGGSIQSRKMNLIK